MHEQKLMIIRLPKSPEKCWLGRDLSSHLRDTGLLLYLLSYRVHKDSRRVLSNFWAHEIFSRQLNAIHERMCSVSILFQNHPQRFTWTDIHRDIHGYLWHPEGASSNPARVNIFELTSALSDYHKFIVITMLVASVNHIRLILCWHIHILPWRQLYADSGCLLKGHTILYLAPRHFTHTFKSLRHRIRK